MNSQGRRQDPRRFAVSRCFFHDMQTTETMGGHVNEQTNVIFREMIISHLNITCSHSPGEDAEVKLK
jgi:hypothetical protein